VPALPMLLQNLAHQGGFRLPGALGLILQPPQQSVWDLHRQRFHALTVTPVCQNCNTHGGGFPAQGDLWRRLTPHSALRALH
jgi:hypothetical protein